MTIKGG
jgi:hypothetical protein